MRLLNVLLQVFVLKVPVQEILEDRSYMAPASVNKIVDNLEICVVL